jgi:Na+-transporting methylmalonyl-CoA/oxaloacetate decarboxylase gamma subunit
MRIYGLEDELIEHQEQEAAEMQTEEFGSVAPVLAAAVPTGTQSTFAWFE